MHCVLDVIEVPAPRKDDADPDSTAGDGKASPPDQSAASVDGSNPTSDTRATTEGGLQSSTGENPKPSSAGDGNPSFPDQEGEENRPKMVPVFRVTLSTLKEELGKFEDFSAGKAWRAALRSMGAEVSLEF